MAMLTSVPAGIVIASNFTPLVIEMLRESLNGITATGPSNEHIRKTKWKGFFAGVKLDPVSEIP